MATLKNLKIDDTGGTGLSSGTGAQRPGVILSGINQTATYGNLGVATDGLRLTIGTNGSAWQSWNNLPQYLRGLVCTTSINDGNTMTWTIGYSCRVYMLRVPTWNTVDTTGWTSFETGKDYISGETNVSVLYKDFSPGDYTFDNDSAMYMFQFTTLAGTIRYNTTKSVFEGYTGQTWTPLNTFRPGNTTVITSTPAPGTWAVPASTTFVNVLIVGGGGGGGLCMGGGGGGGGVRFLSNVPVPPSGTMQVTVGAGGAGSTGRSIVGGKGGDSRFGSFVATGGGGGATWDNSNGAATAGGSGGGGCSPSPTGSAGNTPPVNPPQGYPGAPSGGAIGSYAASGGGGGAGGPGKVGSPYSGGMGGAGVQYALIGGANTNSLSATGGARNTFGGGGMFGGGGAGATNGGRPGTGADGGGDATGGSGTGAAGLTNSGGGGGGGGHGPDGPGGAGGSGIVIIQEITNQSV